MDFIGHAAAAVSNPTFSTDAGPIQMNLQDVEFDATKTTPWERRFNPYDFNGGTTICVAGDDYVICAGCTRMSTGYEIVSRQQSKLFELTDNTVLAAVGCNSDIITLRRQLDARLTQYQHAEGKPMSSHAAAQLLSVTLYGRRFFPYYAFNLLGGIDAEGKGAVYGYDAVGSYKRDDYGAMGSGQNFVIPLLDNLFGHKHRQDPKVPIPSEEAVRMIKEIFIVATERDIHTGDNVEIKVITKAGITTEIFPLKKD